MAGFEGRSGASRDEAQARLCRHLDRLFYDVLSDEDERRTWDAILAESGVPRYLEMVLGVLADPDLGYAEHPSRQAIAWDVLGRVGARYPHDYADTVLPAADRYPKLREDVLGSYSVFLWELAGRAERNELGPAERNAALETVERLLDCARRFAPRLRELSECEVELIGIAIQAAMWCQPLVEEALTVQSALVEEALSHYPEVLREVDRLAGMPGVRAVRDDLETLGDPLSQHSIREVGRVSGNCWLLFNAARYYVEHDPGGIVEVLVHLCGHPRARSDAVELLGLLLRWQGSKKAIAATFGWDAGVPIGAVDRAIACLEGLVRAPADLQRSDVALLWGALQGSDWDRVVALREPFRVWADAKWPGVIAASER